MRKLALAAAGVVAGIGGAYTLTRFGRWKTSRRETLATAAHRIHTERGPMEFADFGEGPAVLVIHGAFGGFDQGSVIANSAGVEGYRYICPSRPGYLGTPLSTGATPEEQADAFASLLDALEIEDAAVVGVSAGGPPAIQFASRHPQRCRSLVLVSAITTSFDLKLLHTLAGKTAVTPFADFAGWMVEAAAWHDPRPIAKLILTKAEAEQFQDPEVQILFADLVKCFVPFSVRRSGFRNDLTWIESEQLPLNTLHSKTLIIHGTEDPVVPYLHAEYAAAQIPGAELITIDGGGHVAGIAFRNLLRPVLEDFLAATSQPLAAV
jgi:pimeloyl-ACP methyl ester carboxylesterase